MWMLIRKNEIVALFSLFMGTLKSFLFVGNLILCFSWVGQSTNLSPQHV